MDEEYQRTKLGFRLYRRFEDRLKEDGVRMVMADTEGGNEEALAFFNELGFSVRGEHIWLAKTMRPRAKKDATNVQASPSTSPRRKHRA